jgi:hypothetical protein
MIDNEEHTMVSKRKHYIKLRVIPDADAGLIQNCRLRIHGTEFLVRNRLD